MKLDFIKLAGGALAPANDDTVESMKRFKNNEQMQVDVTMPRNIDFHRKAFALANKAFAHWCADGTKDQYKTHKTQFESFREQLTILAGYFDEVYAIDGSVRLIAKSWSFGNMTQEQFEHFYSALWQAIANNVVQFDEREHWMMEF